MTYPENKDKELFFGNKNNTVCLFNRPHRSPKDEHINNLWPNISTPTCVSIKKYVKEYS